MSPSTNRNQGLALAVVVMALAAVACKSVGATEIVPLAAPSPVAQPIVAHAVVPPTAAETVAYHYMATRDAADAELAMAMFSDDAIVVDSPVAFLSDHAEAFRLFEILDWRWTVDECIETESQPPAEVTCTYTTGNVWSQALGIAPVDGQIRFGISHGRIVEMYHDFNRAAWDTDVERVFRAWLVNTYPADVESMWEQESFARVDDYEAGFGKRIVPRLTPEALRLFEQHSAEFANSVG